MHAMQGMLSREIWGQFYALTKPRVVQLIVFCAVIGMLLAEPGWPRLQPALAAAPATAQQIEFDIYDKSDFDKQLASGKPVIVHVNTTW